jgi:hypothetical protein
MALLVSHLSEGSAWVLLALRLENMDMPEGQAL